MGKINKNYLAKVKKKKRSYLCQSSVKLKKKKVVLLIITVISRVRDNFDNVRM